MEFCFGQRRHRLSLSPLDPGLAVRQEVDEDGPVVGHTVSEGDGAGSAQAAHEAAVQAERKEALGSMGRTAWPNVDEAGQPGRADGVVVPDYRVQPWALREQGAKLTPVGEPTMIQVHIGDLEAVQTDDQCDAIPGTPRQWGRHITPHGERKRQRRRMKPAGTPCCWTMVTPLHLLADIAAAEHLRQRIDDAGGLLQQHKVRVMHFNYALNIIHPCPAIPQQIPTENTHRRRR